MSPREVQFMMSATKTVCAAVIFAATLYTVWLVGPTLETKFYPVVDRFDFVSVDWNDGGLSAIVTITFTKKRECEYNGVAWYQSIGVVNPAWIRVVVRDPRGLVELSRPLGRQIVGPWHVYMPTANVRERSRVLAYHRCHAFWTTISVMYP